jgi:hypothetical protein
MTDEQRATLDPNSEEYHLRCVTLTLLIIAMALFLYEHKHRVLGSKLQITGYSLYAVLLWSLKAAMCNFYLRLAVSNTLH